jgi:GntR family transcriptional regulator, transcriptional repressor for pyruvate dehydrogenase complex
MNMHSTPTDKLDRQRLSNRAAAAIKRWIVTGTYPPDARLPTEKQLAEKLGVTRLTVREALSQLSAAGFVITRHGSGTYVVDVREREDLALFADTLSAGRRIEARECASLMEFRTVVLTGFADAIAKGASEADVAELRAIVGEARGEREPARLAALDYRFNEVLARASANTFFTLLMRSMREVHLEIGALVYRERDRETILDTLEALADALERRQPQRFAKVLATYVEGAAAAMADFLRKRSRKEKK